MLVLPLWLFGPEAAYNGALLLGFSLSGFFMYLLAIELGLSRAVALFAGIVYLVAPIHLTAVYGHLNKVFLGMLPLTLLFFHRALNLKHSIWWAGATVLALLLTLLHSGEQFVFIGLALVFFMAAIWLAADPAEKKGILFRGAFIVLGSLIVTAPHPHQYCLPLYQRQYRN